MKGHSRWGELPIRLYLWIILLVALCGTGLPAHAQTDGDAWTAPVNLSRSGAASDPALVTGPDGAVRVLWWDRFDGPTVATGSGDVWSEPTPAPIYRVETVERAGEEEQRLVPVEAMPRIVGDAAGRAHAFWLGEPDEETGARPLLHSRLDAGATEWTLAEVAAEAAGGFAATADPAAGLHLAYVRPLEAPAAPAGLYYRRLGGGGSWSAPALAHRSRYLRLLTPEATHLRVAVDGGARYVAWDDPHEEQTLYTRSTDLGASWALLAPAGGAEGRPQKGRVVPVSGGGALLLWEDARYGGGCRLTQVPASDLQAGDGQGVRVLDGLTRCPEDAGRFWPLETGETLMVAGAGSDALVLAAWNGDQWSEPRWLSYRFPDPALDRRVYLSALQAALIPADAEDGAAGPALIVAGLGQGGDVWVTWGAVSALAVAYAPPPAWSEPAAVAESTEAPGLPALAFDGEGRLHALWRGDGGALTYARLEADRWSRPAGVLDSGGGAGNPSLAALGERLHAVWRAGPGGEILYSRAFLRDAYAAGGWREPRALPVPSAAGNHPRMAVDPGGALHVVYAVPVNEGRGIYYTRSGDGGESWSAPGQVFDAATAGWTAVGGPRLAVDPGGPLHVAWLRAGLPGDGAALGLYAARSGDGGESWSAPMAVAEGPVAWVQLAAAAPGQVHLVWGEAGGRGPRHRWTADGGLTWARAARAPGLGEGSGPAALVGDGAGGLYLLALGPDEAGEAALLARTWEAAAARWDVGESFRLAGEELPGLAAALAPALGRLEALYRGEAPLSETADAAGPTPAAALWHTGRAVPAVAITPAPTFTPRPTATPSPTPAPAVTPRPTLPPGAAPPPDGGDPARASLPLLWGGGLAAAIVLGAFGAWRAWAGRR